MRPGVTDAYDPVLNELLAAQGDGAFIPSPDMPPKDPRVRDDCRVSEFDRAEDVLIEGPFCY